MSESLGIALAERGLAPTPLIRRGIRRLCADRLAEFRAGPTLTTFIDEIAAAPVAPVPERANAQHYEVPSAFFQLVLGTHLKYSSAFWPSAVSTLDEAEEAMLALTCERAQLEDGQDVLELGCGWGSLSMYMARRFPRSRIVAVSNSATQRAFIEARCPANVTIVTADMNVFSPGRQFDRIVSVEMFEHMRNWRVLLDRVAGWLANDGQLFIHVFCHATNAYAFESAGASNWMGRHFFTGGIMPAFELLPRLDGPLTVKDKWFLDGRHYERTAAAWRRNLEDRRDAVVAVLRPHYGHDAVRWYHRWRLFFLSCEELFGYAQGTEWGVAHYRLAKASMVPATPTP
jgi:cyclopropane-fatty-acyl-phospholipid synthase